jgi:hypothetical protein
VIIGGRPLHTLLTCVAGRTTAEDDDPGAGDRSHIVCSSFSVHAGAQPPRG